MKKKPTITGSERVRPYLMGLSDKLSDDPLLLRVFGSRFKVVVSYDLEAKRVTYSFRSPDDPGDEDATPV